MAIELGAAYLSILPSTDRLAPAIRKELGAIEGEAKRSGQTSGSSFGSSFKAAAGKWIGRGLLAGAAGVGLLGAAGLKTASDLEQSQIGFETMLGSAKKANDFMGQIQKTAAKTPFELPGLTQSAQKLLAFGFQAKDVIPTLTTLGDAASGLGAGQEGLDRIATAVGQIQAKGKVQSDELLQLTESGVPALKILANGFHTSTADMQDMVTKGLVPANKALPLLLSGLKNGTKGQAGETAKFGGLMKKQSKSMAGLFSTLKDTVLIGTAKAIKPFIPMIEKGLGGAIKHLTPAFRDAGKWARGFVKGMQDGTGTGGKFVAVVKDVAKFVAGTVRFFVKWQDVLVPVGGGILAIVAAYKIWTAVTKTYTAVQAALNVVMDANPIGLIVLAVIGLVAALVIAYKKSDTFRAIVQGAFSKVKGAAQAVADFFTKKIPAAFGKVKDAAGHALGWVKSNWPKILAVLTGPFGLATLFVVSHFGQIKRAVSGAVGWVKGKFGDLVGFVKSLPGKIRSAASGAFDGFRDAFKSAVDWIIGKWNGLSFTLPSVHAFGKTIGGGTISTPDIPYLAKGGVLTRPTLNVAGEAGPEAVIPLDRLDHMLASAGEANAEARKYDNPRPASSHVSGSRRTEFVITNWKTGEGFFREIAEDTYDGRDEFDGTQRRMR